MERGAGIMEYKLIKSNYDNIPLSPIERILTNRGIKRENIQHYLNTTDWDIPNPLLLSNMAEGAKMLIECISNNEPLFL